MKSRQEQDLELVELAQTGDMRAFDTLVTRYKRPLIRYLSTMIRDLGDTEDVVQETFIKAYMGLNSFRGDSSFSTWLFRIGINTAKRSLAQSGRRFLDLQVEQSDKEGSQQRFEGQPDFDTPEARLETKQILNLLDEAMDELPEEQRTSLVLRELEGLSYEEIAEQMHCPVGTVRSRIHRARDAIAAALKSMH